MGDRDYIDEFRNYYNFSVTIIGSNSHGLRSCNNGYPDGKANRRENRRRELRKRKGRL